MCGPGCTKFVGRASDCGVLSALPRTIAEFAVTLMPVLTTKSAEETMALGRAIATRLPARCLVLLVGNLGAGKTTLAKGILEGLGVADPDEVTSPTFTLIHEYPSDDRESARRAYHIDLYRLDTAEEVAGLGLDDLLDQDAVVLIEWGERFPELWPDGVLEIQLSSEAIPEPADGEEGSLELHRVVLPEELTPESDPLSNI